jgi:hypothetical protein
MRMNYNSDGIELGTVPAAALPGEYSLIVRQVFDKDKEGNQKETKNGDPMVSVRLEIDDAGEWLGTTVWHNVIFMKKDTNGKHKKGAGLAIQFLKALNQPHKNDFKIDTDQWEDRTFRAKLKVGKDMNGNPRSEIQYIIDEKEPEAEVPF